MRILIVSEVLVPAGAEIFSLRLTKKLRQLGHDCEILCLNPDLTDNRLLGQFPDIKPLSANIYGLRAIRGLDRRLRLLGFDFEIQRRLTTLLLKRSVVCDFDVVHTNLIGADLQFASIKRDIPSLPLVSTVHGDYLTAEYGLGSKVEGEAWKGWPSQFKRIGAAVDHWVYISAEQRSLLIDRLRIREERLSHIYNGYEPSAAALGVRKPERHSRPVRFIMVSRGSIPEKGWATLLKAFCKLTGEVQLSLIGAGEHLAELAEEYQAHPRIDFCGFHAEPAVLIASSDVFVLPTIYPAESLPTVIVEALAVGVPVISTNNGEIAAMLTTPTGELAGTVLEINDPRPLEDRLAEAMQAYVDDPERLAMAGKVARRAFAKFDMGRCASRYLEVYAQVVAARSEAARSDSQKAVER